MVRRYQGVLRVGAAALLVLPACACRSDGPAALPTEHIARGAAPAYRDVVNAYNARVKRLERLNADVSMVVRASNDKGEKINEQVEGNLMVLQPSSVALRMDKVGKTIFRLGSND